MINAFTGNEKYIDMAEYGAANGYKNVKKD
jgi:hypothetical protein